MKIVETRSGNWSPALDETEQETLFRLALDTLAWCVNRQGGGFDWSCYHLTEKLREPTATFVTLLLGGMLRGCIGSLVASDPLAESIHSNAQLAALRDPRFPPLSPRELPRVVVHVSILSPIEPLMDLDEFHLGEHGIIMEKDGACAVYLPEVAVEQGWTKEQTLSSLSQKAGLSPDAWRTGTRFRVFSSVVLAQHE